MDIGFARALIKNRKPVDIRTTQQNRVMDQSIILELRDYGREGGEVLIECGDNGRQEWWPLHFVEKYYPKRHHEADERAAEAY